MAAVRENLAEGWRHLIDRAGQALTYFAPKQRTDWEGPHELVTRQGARWGVIAAELREEDEQLVAKLEIPGMAVDAFEVDVLENYLIVRGEKKVARDETQGRFHLMECAYGRFERAIEIPVAVDGSRTSARYRHGVLTVTLPKQRLTNYSSIGVSPT